MKRPRNITLIFFFLIVAGIVLALSGIFLLPQTYLGILEIVSIIIWAFIMYVSMIKPGYWINPFSLFFATYTFFVYGRIVFTVLMNYGDYGFSDWVYMGVLEEPTKIKLIWLLNLFMIAFGLSVPKVSSGEEADIIMLEKDRRLQNIGLFFILVSFPFFIYRQIAKFLIVYHVGYDASHLVSGMVTNSFVNILASFIYIGFFLFMCGVPTKRNATLVFAGFTIVSGLSLLQGVRGEFFTMLLASLWIYLYVTGYKIKIIKAAVLVFLMIILADLAASVRMGEYSTHTFGFGKAIDFTYSNGVTVIVPGTAIQFEDNFSIPVDGIKAMLSQFKLFFDVLTGNVQGHSVETALTSWDLSHKLTYMLNEEVYLDGGGIGTSILAEMYLAGGLGAVFILTLIFSKAFAWLYKKARKSNMYLFIFAFTLSHILFMPRGSMFYFFIPLYKSVIAILVIGYILKRYDMLILKRMYTKHPDKSEQNIQY